MLKSKKIEKPAVVICNKYLKSNIFCDTDHDHKLKEGRNH